MRSCTRPTPVESAWWRSSPRTSPRPRRPAPPTPAAPRAIRCNSSPNRKNKPHHRRHHRPRFKKRLSGSIMDTTETVTLANWRRSPWNRWAFHHVSELIPVAMIPRDPARARLFPEARLVPNRLPDGTSIDQVLRESETDGFLVLRDGALLYEWYANGLTP